MLRTVTQILCVELEGIQIKYKQPRDVINNCLSKQQIILLQINNFIIGSDS